MRPLCAAHADGLCRPYHLCPARARAHAGLSAAESAPPVRCVGAHRARGRSGAGRAGAPVGDAAARQRQAACKTVDEQGIGHFRGHPKASLALSRELLPRLRFSSADTERILLLVERHDTPLGDNEKLVRRSLSRIGEARFRDLLAIKKGDAVGQGTSRDYVAQLFETEALLNRVLAQEQCFSLRQLAVNGADLQALGLHGRPVGEMLHALLDAVIDGQTDNRRETLLRLARTRMEEQHVK
ncbi:MAG: hypothetical protein ACLTF5_02005 [Butyricicoccus sp.]